MLSIVRVVERKILVVSESPDLDMAAFVTAAGFHQPESPELRADVEAHMKEGRMVYSVRCGELLGGYALFRQIGTVLYLSGIMLIPDFQGEGLAVRIIKQAKKDSGLDLLGLRTQSLRMWVAGSNITTEWLPRPFERDELDGGELDVVRRRLAKEIGCKSPRSLGFYGRSLYGEKPSHKNRELQAWWDEICCLDEGDAIVCLGRLR